MIELKPIAIKDISEHKFFIRYYQRGYRWTEQQVCQLLDDIEPPRDCRRLNILREYDNEKTNLHS